MTVFIPSSNKVLGDLRTICAITDKGERPVVSVIAAKGQNTLDVDRMTSNVLDVLNNGKPQAALRCSGLRVGWVRHDNAIGFHVQKDENLTSKNGLSFVFVQDCPQALVEEVKGKLTEAGNIKELCEAVSVQREDVKSRPAPSRRL